MATTTPTPAGYDQTKIRSRLVLHWRATDVDTDALSGQSGTFDRTGDAWSIGTDNRVIRHMGTVERWHSEG